MKLIKPNKKYAESYYRAAEIYKEKNIKLYEFFDMPFEQIAEYTEDVYKRQLFCLHRLQLYWEKI